MLQIELIGHLNLIKYDRKPRATSFLDSLVMQRTKKK